MGVARIGGQRGPPAERFIVLRLGLARLVCRFLPPPAAGLGQRMLYPTERGQEHGARFVRRSPTGSMLQGSLSGYHGISSGVRGYSDWRLLAIAVALLRSGDVIVEVGAHVGTETIGYSDIVGGRGRVIAFEANPDNAAELRKALALARQKNVEIIPVALGREAARARFALPETGGSSGTGHLLGPSEDEGAITYYGRRIEARVIDVDCRPLDQYVDELPQVAMLTIDAEGAEVAILAGAERLIERDHPVIVIEASAPHLARAGYGIATLFVDLRTRGYRVYEISHRAQLRELHRAPVEQGSRNWLCLHESKAPKLAGRAARTLLLAALMPMIPGLNPLTHPRTRAIAARGQ